MRLVLATNNPALGILFFVFAIWPLGLFALMLYNLFQRGNWLVVLRQALRRMALSWGVFALAGLLLLCIGQHPTSPLPEPTNTTFFLGTGLVLVPLEIFLTWRSRRVRFAQLENARSLNELRTLTPAQFEELVAETYRRMGHQAKVVGATGDHGIDVLIKCRDGQKWAIQCKRWRSSIGEPVVRDFYGAMLHEKVNKGAIITTGTFTAQAVEWARGKPISLYDGQAFLRLVNHLRKKGPKTKPITAPKAPPKPTITIEKTKRRLPRCPICGQVVRPYKPRNAQPDGRRFYRCCRYPYCKGVICIQDAK